MKHISLLFYYFRICCHYWTHYRSWSCLYFIPVILWLTLFTLTSALYLDYCWYKVCKIWIYWISPQWLGSHSMHLTIIFLLWLYLWFFLDFILNFLIWKEIKRAIISSQVLKKLLKDRRERSFLMYPCLSFTPCLHNLIYIISG